MPPSLIARAASAPRRNFARPAFALCLLALFALAPSVAARAQSSSGSPNVVVSQIYTRGGEPGATFRSDYVEFFNRGQRAVDLRDYEFYFNNGGNTTLVLSFVGSFAFTLNAGQYFLIELASGANGAPLPVAPDGFSQLQLNLSATRGWVAVGRSDAQFPIAGCPSGPDLVDLAGYGTSPCAEGGSPAPSPSVTTAALRAADGCVDSDSNAADFAAAAPNPRSTGSAHNFCAAAGQSVVQFSTTSVVVPETTTAVEIRVRRGGDVSAPATVDYATSDAHTASERSDFTLALGTLRFAAGETEKTFTLLLNDDAHADPGESFEIALSNPTGNAALHPFASTMRVFNQNDDQTNNAPNPADDSAFFVRQHYHDFLNREPDPEGLRFWTDNIESCGADAQCREVKRIDTSAAFFLSIEFQETGFLVHRLYRAALPPPPSGRPRGLPRLREFVRDAQEIGRGVVVGQGDWAARLEANKQEFAARFVERPDFLARYPPTMSAAEYVDALDAHAGSVIGAGRVLTDDQRNVLVGGLEVGTETRGSVLRQIAEHRVFSEAERNRAFVLMQYIGYLRRHPLDPPDFSFAGYDFWLAKLEQFHGNYVAAEMVKAFISSIEYRRRFGQ